MTSYQKLSDPNDRIAFSHGSGGQSPKSRCRRGRVLSETFRGESIPCLSFQWLVASLGLWHSSLCLCHPLESSLCLFTSSKDISHIGLRAHPSSTASLTYILITSTKAMFPSEVMLTGTRSLDHVFWGTQLPPHQLSTFLLIHRHQRLPMKHEGFL